MMKPASLKHERKPTWLQSTRKDQRQLQVTIDLKSYIGNRKGDGIYSQGQFGGEFDVTVSFFCDAQHGFVPGRLWMTQLLATLELRSKILDNGAPLDVISLNFWEKTPFDGILHQRLVIKLKSYAITRCQWTGFSITRQVGNVELWLIVTCHLEWVY